MSYTSNIFKTTTPLLLLASTQAFAIMSNNKGPSSADIKNIATQVDKNVTLFFGLMMTLCVVFGFILFFLSLKKMWNISQGLEQGGYGPPLAGVIIAAMFGAAGHFFFRLSFGLEIAV